VGDVHSAKLLAALLPAPSNGEPLRFIDFAAPLRDAAGQVSGVLGMHVDWAWAQQVIDARRSPLDREQGVRIWIFDRTGALIHRPSGLAGTATPRALAALPTGGADVLRWDDGIDYLTAARRLPVRHPAADLGWTIVVRQPLEAASAGARALRDTTLAAGALAALAAALGAWWLAGHLSRPLGRIAGAARAVEQGALDTEIPRLRGATELVSLSEALRGMTDTLRGRERELEARVQARTTELRAAQAELQRQALHDVLTGLHNRRAGDERLALELARHRRHGHGLSLVMADIDHFKAVNDTHGHAAGDAVLREVAQVLLQHARQTDLVVRHGGEEFLVLMPETDAAGARVAAEKLRAAVQAHAGAVPVTLSLGVASDVQAYADADAALAAADRALYRAKQAGRNRVEPAGTPTAEAAAVIRASSPAATASS
jgi:diguanylate cyclase (GGDEF)-like protein